MKQVLLAFQFLTIVPVRVKATYLKGISRSAAFFPAAVLPVVAAAA
jgi:cobalamin synthase